MSTFFFASCVKEKPKYATFKQNLLNEVEIYTGFEESRDLVSDYIDVLKRSMSLDLKDKESLKDWWDDFHDAEKCLRMIIHYKYNDKSYSLNTHSGLKAKIQKKILGDDFKNFSYLMSYRNMLSRTVTFGYYEEIFDNRCKVSEKRFRDFQVRYILNRNHPDFRKFDKYFPRKYKTQFKELYERVDKIRNRK